MASIRIDKKFKNTLENLSPDKTDKKCFENYAHVASFAAGLAFLKGNKKKYPLKNNPENTEIRDAVLDQDVYKQQIDMLVMAHEGSHKIIEETEENKSRKYGIFQDYVNNGLSIFEKIKSKNPNDESGIDTVIQILEETSSDYVIKGDKSEFGDTKF